MSHKKLCTKAGVATWILGPLLAWGAYQFFVGSRFDHYQFTQETTNTIEEYRPIFQTSSETVESVLRENQRNLSSDLGNFRAVMDAVAPSAAKQNDSGTIPSVPELSLPKDQPLPTPQPEYQPPAPTPEPSKAIPPLSTIRTTSDLTTLVGTVYQNIHEDPGRIVSWNQHRNNEWFSILAVPGNVEGGKWYLPTTRIGPATRLTMNSTVSRDHIALRLLFTDAGKITSSAYCLPGIAQELHIPEHAYANPVQYELVQQQGTGLHVLASGRNLYFSGVPTFQPIQEAPVAHNTLHIPLPQQPLPLALVSVQESPITYFTSPKPFPTAVCSLADLFFPPVDIPYYPSALVSRLPRPALQLPVLQQVV